MTFPVPLQATPQADDAGCNPRSQSGLAGALRTIDTNDASPTICRALQNFGNNVVKAKDRHARTIVVEASAHAAKR